MPASPTWVAYVDGGCHPNPEGVMGVGVVLKDPSGNNVEELAERPPKKGTNNEAEYIAVLRALQVAQDHGVRRLQVFADSKLTVNTLSGRWKVRAPNLVPIKEAIDVEKQAFEQVLFGWVPRAKNREADRLATEAAGGSVKAAGPKYANAADVRDTEGTSRSKKSASGGDRPRAEEEGVLCSACKQACAFRWQRFKDGSWHIRQECPKHGFLRFAPKGQPWEELAGPKTS